MAGRKDVTIVTAADEAYSDLVQGLVCSIRDAEARQSLGEPLPIQVIDLGLSDAAVAELAPYCQVLRRPHIPLPAERTDHPRAFLCSRAVKPLVRDFFPGYEIYLWLDADAWVQNGWAVDWLCKGARDAGLAVVPETDRSYLGLYVKSSRYFQWAYAGLASAFGTAVAQDLLYRPVFNCGAWAARADSPIWDRWRRRLESAFQAPPNCVRDQPAFNVSIYLDGTPFYPLPSVCNWLCCHAPPRVRRDTLVLTEPRLPFQELGVVHLTEACTRKELPVSWDAGEGKPLKLDYLSLQRLRRERREGSAT